MRNVHEGAVSGSRALGPDTTQGRKTRVLFPAPPCAPFCSSASFSVKPGCGDTETSKTNSAHELPGPVSPQSPPMPVAQRAVLWTECASTLTPNQTRVEILTPT